MNHLVNNDLNNPALRAKLPPYICTEADEVRKVKRNGRFVAGLEDDEDFMEEYDLNDEGGEWRRATKYQGLKRQRRAADHYKPDEAPARGDRDVSTRCGPFRGSSNGREGGGGALRSIKARTAGDGD